MVPGVGGSAAPQAPSPAHTGQVGGEWGEERLTLPQTGGVGGHRGVQRSISATSSNKPRRGSTGEEGRGGWSPRSPEVGEGGQGGGQHGGSRRGHTTHFLVCPFAFVCCLLRSYIRLKKYVTSIFVLLQW